MDGIRERNKDLPIIDCHGCGVCCFHMGYPAFNLTLKQLQSAQDGDLAFAKELREKATADLNRWLGTPEALQNEILGAMQEYKSLPEGELDSACIWLDGQSRLCRHHEHRPEVCRDFEIGCTQCLDWRNEYRKELKG